MSNDEELELLVSQRFETSLFMTTFSSRNSFSSSWINSHFSELKKIDDLSNEIIKFDSETKKTKTNKFSIDELMKMQTKEQKMKTISFSISNSFFFTKENDTDDWFSLAKFFKIEEKIEEATNSNTNKRERIKIESQNSQSKWTFSSTENSTKRQMTHTKSSLKFFSSTDFKSSSHSSFFKDDNESKNSTEQTDKQSFSQDDRRNLCTRFSRWWW